MLTFSLEKLVFDDELCGQALHFAREYRPLADLPTVDLVRQLLEERHMLTVEHTLMHWKGELYLPGPTFDRLSRDNWIKAGQLSLPQRVKAEVEKRLAAYAPVETDPRAEAEMRRIIREGMESDAPLPEVPAPVKA